MAFPALHFTGRVSDRLDRVDLQSKVDALAADLHREVDATDKAIAALREELRQGDKDLDTKHELLEIRVRNLERITDRLDKGEGP